MTTSNNGRWRYLVGAAVLAAVSACGGGGSSSPATPTTPTGPTASAPSLSTQPLGATVVAGGVATFTAAATGTAPLTFQWRLNGSAIPGAIGASYTTGTLSAADNDGRYTVSVSNAAGTVVSAEAILNVSPAVSNLLGKAWSAATNIDVNSAAQVFNATAVRVGIDDSGHAMAIFTKVEPSMRTTALYATRGNIGPNGAQSWSTPIAISASNSASGGYVVMGNAAQDGSGKANGYFLAVAPNGNAVVVWQTFSGCTALTYRTNTSQTCTQLVATRYFASSGTWEAPMVVADTPNEYAPKVSINNSGAVAILYSGWVRSGSSFTGVPAVASRSSAGAAYAVTAVNNFSSASIGLDDAGNVTLAGVGDNGASYGALRGAAGAGLGALERVGGATGAAVAEADAAVGPSGRTLLLYSQGSGLHTAASVGLGSGILVQDGVPVGSSSSLPNPRYLGVLSSGDAFLYAGCDGYRWNRVDQTWGLSKYQLPGNCMGSNVVVSPSGDSLQIVPSTGQWSTYDFTNNTMIQPFGAAYVQGSPGPLTSLTNCIYDCTAFALSKSGVAVLVGLKVSSGVTTTHTNAQTVPSTTLWAKFLH